MPSLLRKFNYANIVLHEIPVNQNIGVLSKTGEYKYKPWIGFIELKQAKQLPGAKPVKLEVHSTSLSDGFLSDWVKVEPGKHVQGCMVQEGVYAVTIEGEPRLV